MSGTVSAGQVAGRSGRGGAEPEPPVSVGRGRRWLAAGVVVVAAAAAGGAAWLSGAFRNAGSPSPGASTGSYPTGEALVTRRPLTSQTPVDATLGKAGSFDVVDQEAGTFTSLPALGKVVREGQVLFRVGGSPVVLLYGDVPAWRGLSEGMSGRDVRQLNEDLLKLGYARSGALGPRSGWDYYSSETAYAVGLLQSHHGEAVTGTLALGQAVFLPGKVQITGVGTNVVLGGTAQPGTVALTATSNTPVVTIDLDASQQTEVRAGEPVSITLPSGRVTTGVVSSVSNVATSSSPSAGSGNSGSSATVAVEVALSRPAAAGGLDQAPVTVEITTGSVSNALVVPVAALLARPGGEYAVEVTGPGGHHLVPVSPGLFDDAAGLVQVTGAGLAAGQHVVVPGT